MFLELRLKHFNAWNHVLVSQQRRRLSQLMFSHEIIANKGPWYIYLSASVATATTETQILWTKQHAVPNNVLWQWQLWRQRVILTVKGMISSHWVMVVWCMWTHGNGQWCCQHLNWYIKWRCCVAAFPEPRHSSAVTMEGTFVDFNWHIFYILLIVSEHFIFICY